MLESATVTMSYQDLQEILAYKELYNDLKKDIRKAYDVTMINKDGTDDEIRYKCKVDIDYLINKTIGFSRCSDNSDYDYEESWYRDLTEVEIDFPNGMRCDSCPYDDGEDHLECEYLTENGTCDNCPYDNEYDDAGCDEPENMDCANCDSTECPNRVYTGPFDEESMNVLEALKIDQYKCENGIE